MNDPRNTNATKYAQDILVKNSREDSYTVPAEALYPFQWNWDSCFTALGWITFNEARAWKELETLFSGQWDNGKLPHIIFHQHSDSYFPGPDVWKTNSFPETSGITQPPVAAMAVRMAYEYCQDKDKAAAIIESLLPKILKYHKWYHENRDPHKTGMVASLHPWETGRDNSAEWDVPLKNVPLDNLEPYKRLDTNHINPEFRPSNKDYDYYIALVQFFVSASYDPVTLYEKSPFKIADIGINAILLRANKDLLWLLRHFKSPHDDITQVREWISLQQRSLSYFWNDKIKAYGSIDLITGNHTDVLTSGSFLPFLSGDVPNIHADTLIEKLTKWREKEIYLLPSLDPEHPFFEAKRYWRGPVWPIVNFMVATGLKEQGYTDFANQITKDTSFLIANKGFKEYYDPFTGEELGGKDFSWTAAMWLFWLSPNITPEN